MVRRHDVGMTPYGQMLQSGTLVGARRTVAENLYLSLNPLWLSRQIDAETDKLLGLAWRRGQPLSILRSHGHYCRVFPLRDGCVCEAQEGAVDDTLIRAA